MDNYNSKAYILFLPNLKVINYPSNLGEETKSMTHLVDIIE